ncbi:MAG: hypothetical protein WDA12_00590 [Bacilli bacterium]
MKKRLWLTIIMIILITGCGEKKLTCTSNGKTEDMTIKQKYFLTIEDKNITKVKSEKEYIFKSNDLYNSFETVVNHSKSNIEELDNSKIKFNTKKTKDSYKLTMEVNMKDVDEEEITSLGLNKNLDEFKKTLEEQGLTCK